MQAEITRRRDTYKNANARLPFPKRHTTKGAKRSSAWLVTSENIAGGTTSECGTTTSGKQNSNARNASARNVAVKKKGRFPATVLVVENTIVGNRPRSREGRTRRGRRQRFLYTFLSGKTSSLIESH